MDAPLTNRTALDAGIFSVKSGVTFSEFSRHVQDANPIFTRHIQPVDETIKIDRSKDDFLRYIELFQANSDAIHEGQKVAIQVRHTSGVKFDYTTFGVKEALDTFVKEKGAISVIQDPEQIVSLFLAKDTAYYGISVTNENLSSWPGGATRFSKADNQVSRSQFKLEEACIVFDIHLGAFERALDLGAAPGGWTSFLLDQGLQVTSVDTGELDSQILEHQNLTFLKKNAAEVVLPEDIYDVITCDMSWDPIHTAKMVLRLAPSLKNGGIAIITIKLMNKKILKTITDFLRILEPEFKTVKVKQLFHNRDEVTAFLTKK